MAWELKGTYDLDDSESKKVDGWISDTFIEELSDFSYSAKKLELSLMYSGNMEPVYEELTLEEVLNGFCFNMNRVGYITNDKVQIWHRIEYK